MVRLINVTLPETESDEILALLDKLPEVHGLSSFDNTSDSRNKFNDCVLISFRTTDKETESVLRRLEQKGVGSAYGHIDIITLQGTRPRFRSSLKKRKILLGRNFRVSDRLSIEEITEFIDSQNHLTFNYLSFVATAAVIASVGLATNSTASVVASMLVAPLMGPILAVTFGSAVGDTAMLWKGIRNEFWGFLLTFAVGFMWGIGAAFSETLWGTNQQTERGNLTALIGGIGIAIPSGVAVAVAATGGGISALVGVAISAALLPPIVNSAMYFAYSIMQALKFGFFGAITGDAWASCKIALYSFALFTANFVFIYIFALLTFYMKRVRPGKGMHRTHERMALSSLNHHGYANADDDLGGPPLLRYGAADMASSSTDGRESSVSSINILPDGGASYLH